MFLKHNNVFKDDTFMWNWSKSVIFDDAIFIASCIREAISDEI